MATGSWVRRSPTTAADLARKAKYNSPEHRKARRYWAPKVATGAVNCWRCQGLIEPGTLWHVGHDDHDTSLIRGPEHAMCNLRAGARKGNRAQRAAQRASVFVRASR